MAEDAYYQVKGKLSPDYPVVVTKFVRQSNGMVVPSSSYRVALTPEGGVTCTCPAFMYRGKCKHQSIARAVCPSHPKPQPNT